MQKLILTTGILLLGFVFTFEGEVTSGPGPMAPHDPMQIEIEHDESFEFKGIRVVPKAELYVQARVLGAKRYRTGFESDLSPVDLALGWGPMSDESNLEHIDIRQSGRWYRWKSKNLPIPQPEVSNHSANMHIIPATPEIAEQLKEIREGQIIHFVGKLVNIESGEGWQWNSSMTRTDRGSGACEVVFLEAISVL